MEVALSASATYREVEAFVRSIWEPGFGQPLDAGELAPHPDGRTVAFTATWWERLEGRPGSRIGIVDTQTGHLEIATRGPHRDRLPAWSPDGRTLAFLSDRAEPGVDQLWLLDEDIGEARSTPAIDGVVESLAWSPDGSALLMVVAGRGAELAGVQGSGSTTPAAVELPSWTPSVDAGDAEHHWRRLWRHDLKKGRTQPVLRGAGNVWEATWAGPHLVAAVVSDGPAESSWYHARLEVLDLATGAAVATHRPRRQLGWPSASSDGRYVAVIDALASDRAVIYGDLILLDISTGDERRVDTRGIDVSHTAWRDPTRLVLSGHRGARTVVAEYDIAADEFREHWDDAATCGGRFFPAAWPQGSGEVVLVTESHAQPPAIQVLGAGPPTLVHSFAHAGSEILRRTVGSFEPIEWTAPDGRLIEGFLALPKGEGPFPLVVEVHGGPVGASRNIWPARARLLPVMLHRGFAHFWPNPRGSSGRGQEFAELVYGDMAGDDVLDVLSGVDAVVERFPIDAARLAVTGGSYGGYMTYALTTRDDRFGAAVALCPISDFYSAHWGCNIPEFCRLFLGAEPDDQDSHYWTRSPIHYAAQCRTPMLNVVGALDRCAPTVQGEFFHRALLEHGNVESVLVNYPQEGHGVQSYPAAIDYLARVVCWFEDHLS
ncbi:MAG TPA: prolyl oligopeptidase family serine peptidase [Acidimicrobiales bacterium]|nr:prolyl oligopeptidase family serine peptidase [Acidimicrobiales bacterium]